METSVRYEDRLEGVSNFLQWKVQITSVLKENRLWIYASAEVTPLTNDPLALDLHEVKEAKA